MNENWCALCIAILNPQAATVEKAFELFEKGKLNKRARMLKKDLEDAIKLKKEMTYAELGKIYGRTDSGICHLMTKYKEGKYDNCIS
ncbi:hypothetical protein FDG04_02230 [Clostridium sporogenes]|uniref:hypothetical protein n=1 Tax=Clostridium sporogenes TaxID=1509 RepID=UPI0013D14D82|nr:hypothetical protein [Clostridium sporogenes]NFQ84150.1 hypothetical protein [Clostridium sporogenes]